MKKKEAKIFYNGLSENNITKVILKIYTEISSSYNNKVFKNVVRNNIRLFLAKF